VRALIFVLCVIGTVGSAAAQGVTSRLDAFRVEAGAAGERLVPAERVRPGQVVEYRLTYRNETGGPVTGFVATGPVPEGTRFVAGTAGAPEGAVLEATAPGADWATPPLIRELRRPDGTIERVTVDPSEFTALRWRLGPPLGADEELTARYRVTVEK
jgi:uncharacterized repeat protein (TIGR01451 family)